MEKTYSVIEELLHQKADLQARFPMMALPKSAMISCNDGFRPVSFYLEALEEDAE